MALKQQHPGHRSPRSGGGSGCCNRYDRTYDTLGVLSPEEFQALGGEHLANLANTTGGYGLLGLGGGQLFTMVDNIDVGAFGEFDPSVVGGIFAGLDQEQIAGIDYDAMDAAQEAAGAAFLGSQGDFAGIDGASTAFGELAGLTDLGAALEQDGAGVIHDGAFDLFGGDLFGSN